MSLRTIFLAFAFLALSVAIAACGSPCEELAQKVCNCMPTRAKVDRCKININAAVRNYDLSDEQEDRCQKILDQGSCKCSAVLSGDYHACGLAYDPLLGQ